ncbi:YegP family protein [Pseudarthrobacter sp. Fe7]|nr:YegP family protein [Pseudarthrobacter sp. Fe7]
MAGTFELFVDEDSQIRFRLVMPDGHVLAVSGQFTDKHAAAAAIEEVRECAGTGLIQDVAPPPPGARLSPAPHPRYAVRHGTRRLSTVGVA